VHAWLIWAPPEVEASEAPTIVVCHANAGNMALRLQLADHFVNHVGANVRVWGWGRSRKAHATRASRRLASATRRPLR
jgi:hypothetical protein